jgi:hypothetical protein
VCALSIGAHRVPELEVVLSNVGRLASVVGGLWFRNNDVNSRRKEKIMNRKEEQKAENEKS